MSKTLFGWGMVIVMLFVVFGKGFAEASPRDKTGKRHHVEQKHQPIQLYTPRETNIVWSN